MSTDRPCDTEEPGLDANSLTLKMLDALQNDAERCIRAGEWVKIRPRLQVELIRLSRAHLLAATEKDGNWSRPPSWGRR